MASLKQTAANRRNAQRSTGPRSAAGKAASRANALRTGIYAECETILPHEDPAALDALAADYYEQYDPQTPAERCLVDSLVSDEWLLRRFRRVEGEVVSGSAISVTGDTRTLGDAYDMNDKTLERLQRRINATRKSYLKTLEALESLRAAARVERQPPAPGLRPMAPASQPLTPEIGFVPPSPPLSSILPPPASNPPAKRAGTAAPQPFAGA